MKLVFGLRNTRWITGLLFEGGLVFSVVYLLTVGTQSVLSQGLAPTDATGHVSSVAAIASLVFLGTLVGVPSRRLHGTLTVRRQLLISCMLCAGVGIVAFVGCWFATRFARPAGASLSETLGLIMLEGAVAVPLVVTAWRWTTAHLRVLEGHRERVMILGTSEPGQSLARWIATNCPAEYAIVGFASSSEERNGQIIAAGVRQVAAFEDLRTACEERVDRIIVALEEKRGVLPTRELMELRLTGITIEDATTFMERASGKIAVEQLLPSWLIFSDGFRVSRLRMFMKRISDLVLSSVLLLVSLPVMLLTAVAIRIDSRGPITYRQKRVGYRGREFELIKFRSMVQDAEVRSGPAWASARDPRVTRVGKWIRKTRIDELPQLLNVFRGEMSFVGPRPERRHFVDKLREEIPFFDLRLAVRPGITGWAQVQYGYGSTVDENREKLRYDLFYIKNLSFLLDFWIVVKTIGVVLRGSGAR